MLAFAVPVRAEAPPPHFVVVRAPDGTLWMVEGGYRMRIDPHDISAAEIAHLQEFPLGWEVMGSLFRDALLELGRRQGQATASQGAAVSPP